MANKTTTPTKAKPASKTFEAMIEDEFDYHEDKVDVNEDSIQNGFDLLNKNNARYKKIMERLEYILGRLDGNHKLGELCEKKDGTSPSAGLVNDFLIGTSIYSNLNGSADQILDDIISKL